jgi:amino acid transporter
MTGHIKKRHDNKKEEDTATTATTTTTKDGSTKSKGTLTLSDLILMGLANIVGAGIFVIIGKSIKYGGNKSLLALLVVATISLIMGFCYIEIYSRHKSSITEYLAVQGTMGNFPGQITLYLIYFFAIFSGGDHCHFYIQICNQPR